MLVMYSAAFCSGPEKYTTFQNLLITNVPLFSLLWLSYDPIHYHNTGPSTKPNSTSIPFDNNLILTSKPPIAVAHNS